jgi:hypothetical protein
MSLEAQIAVIWSSEKHKLLLERPMLDGTRDYRRGFAIPPWPAHRILRLPVKELDSGRLDRTRPPIHPGIRIASM